MEYNTRVSTSVSILSGLSADGVGSDAAKYRSAAHASESSALEDPLDPRCVEEVALALVREYLNRRGYVRALETLHSELVVPPVPTSRLEVAEKLALGNMLRRNKERGAPFTTLVEILCDTLMSRAKRLATPSVTSAPGANAPASAAQSPDAHRGNGVAASGKYQPTDEKKQSATRLAGSSTGAKFSHSQQQQQQQLYSPQPASPSLSIPASSSKQTAAASAIAPSTTFGQSSRSPQLHTGPALARAPSYRTADSSLLQGSAASATIPHTVNTSSSSSPLTISGNRVAISSRPAGGSLSSTGSPDGLYGANAASAVDRKPSYHPSSQQQQQQQQQQQPPLGRQISSNAASHSGAGGTIITGTLGSKHRGVTSTGPAAPVLKTTAAELTVEDFDHDDHASGLPAGSDNDHHVQHQYADPHRTNRQTIMDNQPQQQRVHSLQSSAPAGPHSSNRQLTLDEACALRTILFGQRAPLGQFSRPWMEQSFQLEPNPDLDRAPELAFGLVQHKGGPCGIIAAVQAAFIRRLIWQCGPSSSRHTNSSSSPVVWPRAVSNDELKYALVEALTDILWQAGESRSCRVVCPRGSASSKAAAASTSHGQSLLKLGIQLPSYRNDGWTETLCVVECTDRAAVAAVLRQHWGSYTEPAQPGVPLMLYSLLMSRGLARVIVDKDEAGSSLIGAHGYCTQEMVNLALLGCARSNVFDGDKSLGEMVMRGIDTPTNIGFLSLFEAYGSMEVGAHYKCPQLPIWVICSESHYTVLFAANGCMPTDSTRKPFDLWYYDQLMQQQDVIRLTIDPCPARGANLNPGADATTVPPLNECIRTKWRGSRVDWNGAEPIL